MAGFLVQRPGQAVVSEPKLVNESFQTVNPMNRLSAYGDFMNPYIHFLTPLPHPATDAPAESNVL